MLITKYINIKMNRGNLGYYNRVMGKKYKIGESDDIPIELIPKTMNVEVDVSCDICETNMKKKYKAYNSCLGYGFYTCNKCKNVKTRMTNMEKYGVENFVNVEKRNETMMEKYGFYNNNRQKYKDTCLDRYGEENVSKVISVKEKKKNTSLSNWGVENVFMSEIVKAKSCSSMLERYGVKHANQNSDIFIKSEKSGFKIKYYKGIFYRGTYELDFIKHCEAKNIFPVNGPSIEYVYLAKQKVYHSDFYLEELNLICEVKSKYTFLADYNLNIQKQNAALSNGYNFLFIIDKKYVEFDGLL